MNRRILIRIIFALILLIAAAAGAYLVVRYANKEKLRPALEKYESSDDAAELREALTRNCSNGNTGAIVEFADWARSHKRQFLDITDGFSDLAQKKSFGTCFAEAVVGVNGGDDFIQTFKDGNTEILNIIRADIVRAQNAKKK
jgi:hypothetical protein